MQDISVNMIQLQKELPRETASAKHEPRTDSSSSFKTLLERSARTDQARAASAPEDGQMSRSAPAERTALQTESAGGAEQSAASAALLDSEPEVEGAVPAKKAIFTAYVPQPAEQETLPGDAEGPVLEATLDVMADELVLTGASAPAAGVAVSDAERPAPEAELVPRAVPRAIEDSTEGADEAVAAVTGAAAEQTEARPVAQKKKEHADSGAVAAAALLGTAAPEGTGGEAFVAERGGLDAGRSTAGEQTPAAHDVLVSVGEHESLLVSVVDERTSVSPAEEQGGQDFRSSLESAVPVKEGTVDLSSQIQQDIVASDSQSAAAAGSTFQEMLSQQLEANAGELVRAGNIVLRDNNSGTINLNVRPESLGTVKINLEVSDRILEAHITVHSKEAYEAFKQNLGTLRQAFQENGFESAHFTVNVADSALASGSFAGNGGHAQEGQQFRSERAYGEYAWADDGGADGAAGAAAYDAGGDYQIDVVA